MGFQGYFVHFLDLGLFWLVSRVFVVVVVVVVILEDFRAFWSF